MHLFWIAYKKGYLTNVRGFITEPPKVCFNPGNILKHPFSMIFHSIKKRLPASERRKPQNLRTVHKMTMPTVVNSFLPPKKDPYIMHCIPKTFYSKNYKLCETAQDEVEATLFKFQWYLKFILIK